MLFLFSKKHNRIWDVPYLQPKNLQALDLFFQTFHKLDSNPVVSTDFEISMGYLLQTFQKGSKLQEVKEQLIRASKELQNEKVNNLINKQIIKIILGITQGFSIHLELKGIGYTAHIEPSIISTPCHPSVGFSGQLEKNLQNLFSTGTQLIQKTESLSKKTPKLILNLGTSHNLVFDLSPYEISTKINGGSPGQTSFLTLSFFGISYETIKNVAAKIYLIKKPEPYKGKGIRYDGEKFFPKEKRKKS